MPSRNRTSAGRRVARFLVWSAAVLAGSAGVASAFERAAPAARTDPAYASDSASAGDLYAVGVDDRGLRKLTPQGRVDGHPAISPDGRRIAFVSISRDRVSAAGFPSTLWLMNLDGSQPREISTLRQATGITWSRDGRSLAFTALASRPPSGRALYVADIATGRARKVASSAGALDLSWSPDGRLAYTLPGAGAREPRVVVVDRGGRPLWTQRGVCRGWSPSGSRIALVRGPTVVVASRAGRALLLFQGRGPVSWSPDGRKIAFARDHPRALWVLTLRDRSARRIALTNSMKPPLWSPGSRTLAYEGIDGSYVAASEGRVGHRLPADGVPLAWTSDRSLLVVRPGPSGGVEFAVAPVGQGHTAVLARFDDSQVAAMLTPDGRTALILHALY